MVESHRGLDYVVSEVTLHRYASRTVVAVRSNGGRFVVKVCREGSALGQVELSVAEIDRRRLPFGAPNRRWRRIQHVLAHEAEPLSALDGGTP